MNRSEKLKYSVSLHDSSKNVHDISTVSVRYRYESMMIHDGNATVNED